MTVGQDTLAVILMYSVLLGIFLGAVYDVFRIRRLAFSFKSANKRLMISHERIECAIIFFEDILYALICSVVSCIFIFYMNSGRFRSLAIIGALVGFVVYYNTLGRLVIYCSGYIIRFVRFVFGKIILYIVLPIWKLLFFIISATLGKLFVYVYTGIYKAVVIKSAEKGFGITKKKGKIKNEEPFKYIRKSGGSGVHTLLHRNHNSDAV